VPAVTDTDGKMQIQNNLTSNKNGKLKCRVWICLYRNQIPEAAMEKKEGGQDEVLRLEFP
jgi:hypothetical protein